MFYQAILVRRWRWASLSPVSVDGLGEVEVEVDVVVAGTAPLPNPKGVWFGLGVSQGFQLPQKSLKAPRPCGC